MLTLALGGASLLLGIYILVNNLFINDLPIPESDISYHLGCYDTSVALNHSEAIAAKLSQIQTDYQSRIKLGMYNSKALSPNFQDEVTVIARNFQIFLDEYYKLKSSNSRNMQHKNALFVAQKNVEECQSKIKQIFNEKECNQIWQNYDQLVQQFNGIKELISLSLDKKQNLQQQLAAMVISHNYADTDQILERYNIDVNELEKKLAEEEINLSEIKSKKKIIEESIRFATDDLARLNDYFSECKRSQHDIHYCRDISKEVKKIGNNKREKDKQELSKRVAVKKKIIKGLESTLQKLRKIGSQSEIMEALDMINSQKIELHLLNQQIVNFQISEEAKCEMCSDQRLNQLKNNITQLTEKRASYEAELILSVQFQITTGQRIKDLRKQISDLENDREAQLSAQFCFNDTCKTEQKLKINAISKSLNQIKAKIIDNRLEITRIEQKIADAKKIVQAYLPNINQMEICLRKKEFYEQLKKNKPSIDESMPIDMLNAKNVIKKELAKL